MKKLVFFLLCTLLFAACVLPTFAYTVQVTDRADIMEADGMEIDVDAEREIYLENVSFHVLTYVADDAYDYPADSFVENLLGINGDAVVLVVRLVGGSTYYYDMYLYGEPDSIFTDADMDRVLDDPAVYSNLKAGNIHLGATSFFSLSAEVIADHFADEATRQANAPLMAVVFGAVAGVVVAGVSVLGVVLYYRKKQHGETYPLDRYARLNLTHQEDRFVGSFVTRVRVQSSSGSRGGGGGRRGGR